MTDEPGNEAAVHAKRRCPRDVGQRDPIRGPALQRGDNGRGWVIIVEAPELVAVQVANERDPAILGQRREQNVPLGGGDQGRPVARQVSLDLDIADERDTGIGLACQHLFHREPGDAVRSARADHPLRLSHFGAPVGALQGHASTILGGVDSRRRDAPLDLTAQLGQMAREDLLRAPLRLAALKLMRAAGAGERDLPHWAQLTIEYTRAGEMFRPDQERIQDLRTGQNLQRARLKCGRASLVMGHRLALDHPGA